jgi:uncharacterized membrane protein
MRIGRQAAALLVPIALAISPPADAQPPQAGTFELAMCNISNVPSVFVALAHRDDAQNWRIEGWYAIPDWGCALIGKFMRDTIHVYAEGQDGSSWKAVETDRSGRAECVDHKKWFAAVAGASTCEPGQTRVRFRMLQIAPDEARLTWSITGAR